MERRLLLIAFFVSLAFPKTIVAHQLDEYLQATLVAIEPGDIRLQINLTPGVAVADQVLAQIDRDNDGVISANESAAYAELLKRDLILRLDGRNLDLKLIDSEFPAPVELRTGFGIIQVEFSAMSGPLTAGTHTLTLQNRHLPTVSSYLVNAAKPERGSVQITTQKRNVNQSTGEIDFTLSLPPNSSRTGIVIPPAILATLLGAMLVGLSQATKRFRASRPKNVVGSVPTSI